MFAITALERSRSATSAVVVPPISTFAVLSVTGLATVSALVLLERRLAGALTQPLDAGLLVGIAAIVVVAATAMRLVDRPVPTRYRDTARWIITASLPLLAVALTLPLSPPVGLAILWLSIVGAEVQLWRRGGESALAGAEARAGHSIINGAAAEQVSRPLTPLDPGAAQQLIYRQTDDRPTTVEGWLRAAFAPGERTVNAHVAFCPAFSTPPQVDVELAGGPDCAIRQALVLPWGVRFELKLAEPAAAPSYVTFEFLARERSAAHPPAETVS